MAKWLLDDSLRLVRALQPETRQFGYHLALGGSVLNVGESEKDLDLYFLPLNNTKIAKENPNGMVAWLAKLWGEPEPIGHEYDDPPDAPPQAVMRGRVQVRAQEFFQEPNRRRYILNNGVIQQVNEDAPPQPDWPQVPVQWDGFNQQPEVRKAPPKPPSSYKYRLKFNRPSGDRIDVFILA